MLEDTLRAIFEYSPVAYCLVDLNGIFIDVNEAAARLVGYSREEVEGKKFSEINIITPNQFAKLESSIDSRKKGQASEPKEYILNRKDGSQVFVESRSFPVKSGDQNLILTMVLDVTDRKRAHELLLQQHQGLRNFSRRMLSIREEEKRMLSANIHREVGHITGAINLLADSIEKDIRSSDLQAALESCQKFKSICHGFASNLRRLALDLRPPELDLLGLSSALSNYFREIEKETGLRIEFESNMNEKKIRDGMPIAVFRIVQEAVNNILKHSQANRVRVDLQSRGGLISLAIKDNGRGFAPEKDKKNAESGMGLQLIREMAESLDGTFEISSSPGKGTELLVSLPAAKPPHPKPPSTKRKSKRNCKRKCRR